MKKQNPIVSGRTRFGDIVTEFWMPRRPSTRAIILCDGCPSVPQKHRLGEYLAGKGFWVFHIRYRGTWESGGEFLRDAPDTDVRMVARALNDGFTEMWTGIQYFLDITDITVVGASFGGACALLSSLDPVVDRVIALAPMVDWRELKGGESFDEFMRQIREGYMGAYRAPQKNFAKLKAGKFYNPMVPATKGAYDPRKLFVIHALDDKVIPIAPLRKFARTVSLPKSHLFALRKGGHLSTSLLREKMVWMRVKQFLLR